MSRFKIVESDELHGRLRDFLKSKSHSAPTKTAIRHLQDVIDMLNEETPLSRISKSGYVHREKNGVYATDQTGTPGRARQIRLYYYPDLKNRTVYVLRVGDKSTQTKDVIFCRQYVAKLRKALPNG